MTAANLPREARALLDAIARGESDPTAKAEGISPYVILYGGGSFEGFPDRPGYFGFPEWGGKDNSHAAGRYQFEPATWLGITSRFAPSVPNFRNPDDQDWGAWFLAQQDYRARTGSPLPADLHAGNLDNIGGVLQPTWTSLSNSTFRVRYISALANYPAGGPSPAPAPSGPVFIPAKPKPSVPLPAPTLGSPEVTVAAMILLQTVLAVDGYYLGPIDGKPNTALTAALAKYGDWLDRPTS